ncbi:serine/threonine protein kinase, CMGC, CDC2/CDK sub [Friedmanniomyces endolithicus]|nr:serine/threonine protein kinase, CMGC, CDC2/CDK sub [Friedmanniomyces endolithicus]
MVGSPASTLGEQQGAGHDSSKDHRARSPERGRKPEHVRSVRIGGDLERVESQEPEEGEGRSAPPHFPRPQEHQPPPSPHHHRKLGRIASRSRSPPRPRGGARDTVAGSKASSEKWSADRKLQHSHRHRHSSTSHHRRLSDSRSPSPQRQKQHRRRSSKSADDRALPKRERGSGRQERAGASVRSERFAAEEQSTAVPRDTTQTRKRPRSESRDAHQSDRRQTQASKTERREGNIGLRHTSRHSPTRDYRREHLTSPPPPRVHRSERDARQQYKQVTRDEEDTSRPGLGPAPRREERARHRHQRSRSPRIDRQRRDSGESFRVKPRQTREHDYDRRSRRSLSKESHCDREDEMHGRGAPYGGHPSNHHGHRGGYAQSGYPSHVPSPMQGHPQQQQSPYPYQQGPSTQSGVPYYQPKPSKQFSNPPSHSGGQTPQRGGSAHRGGRGHGHFANLSWTPGEGVKGGNLVQPGEKSREGSAVAAPSGEEAGTEDENNPFRPPADMRAEDESANKRRRPTPGGPTAHTVLVARTAQETVVEAEKEKNKISFSIKGRASLQSASAEKTPSTSKPETSPLAAKKVPTPLSPLVQSAAPKSRLYVGNTRVEPSKASPPLTRKETVRKKRIKARPTLSEDFVQSESVYYRKTGNESVIGSGTYGKVYKAMHVYTGRMVALKKLRMEGERDGFPVTATREIKLLQSLNHINVVPLQEVMVERNDCFMVFEYQAHDLTGLLNHPTFALTDAHKKHLAKQMFEGLEYLHRRGVLHRDIKAANILVSKTGELKFADFGLARFYQKRQKQEYTNRVITIWYRPPELLFGETQYGPAVDIWSAACVLVEIFTRHAIFPGDGGEINQLDKIYNVLGTPSRSEWPGITELQWYELLRPTHRLPNTFAEKYKDSGRISDDAFELLEAMLSYDPANRPMAADVLEHRYFHEGVKAQQVWELADLEGDWHEFESKALRKEKEKQERENRRREREVVEKRKAEEGVAGPSEKRQKTIEVAG